MEGMKGSLSWVSFGRCRAVEREKMLFHSFSKIWPWSAWEWWADRFYYILSES